MFYNLSLVQWRIKGIKQTLSYSKKCKNIKEQNESVTNEINETEKYLPCM